MAVTIIANGHLGTLKKQRVSTNTTNVPLSTILNNANIIPPVTNEPSKVFSFWGTTINGFDISGYTINQLYSLGAITKDGILNIYANYGYAANAVQITFNANGGKFADGTTTKVLSVPMGSIYGELDSQIDLPTLSGKVFSKWTDPSNTIVNGYTEFTDSVTVTAQWETATNVNITAMDSRGKSVISGSYPKSTLWKDLYAQAVSAGYIPDDKVKPLANLQTGGQAIKKIDFSVANSPMKIGWLRGSIYDLNDIQLNNQNQKNEVLNSEFSPDMNGWRSAVSSFVVDGTYNGSPRLRSIETTKEQRIYTNLIDVRGRSVISARVYNDSWVTLRAFDNTQTYIKELMVHSNNGTFGANTLSNIVLPPEVCYVDFGIQSSPGGYIAQPIVVFDTAVGDYVKGQYVSKKIRDFSATTIPVDPSATFAVTGKATNSVVLTHNPISQDEYWTNRNLLTSEKDHISIPASPTNAYNFRVIYTNLLPGMTYTFSADVTSNSDVVHIGAFDAPISKEFKGMDTVVANGRISFTFTVPDTETLPGNFLVYPGRGGGTVGMTAEFTKMKIAVGTNDVWTPAMEDIKPGLWINNNWLYNPYTQKWLDTPIDNADYSYSGSVITFKDYMIAQYVTGDLNKIRSSVTVAVKSVVAGYGSTTDKHSLYNNSYFPASDSGITLKVEEYFSTVYINFYNSSTGYMQKVTLASGTLYSEFLKLINKPKFDLANKFMKGFYTSNYWTNSKLVGSTPINSPIDHAFSGYLDPSISSFVKVIFDGNGGTFYKGTSYETNTITMDLSPDDTYGIAVNYLPDISKRTMGLLYWVMDLDVMEPAYPLKVQNGQTLYSKWSVVDRVELYRKPREYYLIDLKSIYNGWDMMDKFNISDRNNIFVIDPTGTGASYSETNSKSNSNGWGKYDRSMATNAIEFDAYYKGYKQYNRLGRWIRGKELVLAMLNETGVPTYWTVEINEIERTEIKHGTDILTGKMSFNKTSPAFDLEFIGLGTDNTIDNADDMFRRNAYVYIHSLQVPDEDNGIQIIATNGTITIEDSVEVDLPAGSYFEYSTLPFRESWKYGPGWKDLPNNLYNNIIDLVGARPIRVGIGKWDISVSSSNKVTINSLAPHKIQDYAGKTIDSLGGLGPFTGIAIKEKEL